MHNLTKTLAAMSLLVPMTAHSLGIGDIKLHSALNQRLDAEVALSLAADEELSDIKVSLATPDKFDEAGIAWNHFLSKLKFKPVLKANGKVVVKITSNEVVQEPFLDFLVEVSWPKGDIFKEFTVLVDPPIVYQQRAVDTPDVLAEKTVNGVEGVKVANQPADFNALVVNGKYGPTSRNDSLWKVAEKVNQHSDVSIEQVMMALYKANPDAFYKKNVNALMAGKTLKIPEKSDIIELSKQQANRQFYRQMAVWEGRAVDEPEEQIASDVKTSSQLTLVPPSEETVSHSDYLTANANDERAFVVENQQLQERLANLEKQFAIMQEMLAIKNQQLATLQNARVVSPSTQTDTALEQATPPDFEVPDKAEESATQKTSEESLMVIAPAPVVKTEQSRVSQEISEQAKPPVPVQTTVHRGVNEQSVEQDSSFNYYLGLGLFGVLACASLGWLVWQRRKAEEDMSENSMFAASSEIILPSDDEELAVPVLDEMPSSYDVGTVGESSFLSEFTPSDFGVFETDQAEIDPTAETDVYLAYGRYQQAEDLMRQAIIDHPDRDAYKLKLLEIFYASENEQSFEEFAHELIAQGKDEDLTFWSRVSEMGSEIIPESALFSSAQKESKFEVADFSPDEPLEVESSSAVVDDESSELKESAQKGDQDNSDIDFDLSSFALNDDASEVVGKDASEVDSIDFDLSSFEPMDTAASGNDDAVASDLSKDLEQFNFDFDSDDTGVSLDKTSKDAAVADMADSVETIEFNVEETSDISLDDFEFTTEGEATSRDSKVSESIETLDFNFDDNSLGVSEKAEVTPENIPESIESVAESGFDFDFEDKPEADEPVSLSEQDLDVFDLTDMDEFETKIDLAKAYIDMGDEVAAREIANEVVENGSDAQKKEAQSIIDALG